MTKVNLRDWWRIFRQKQREKCVLKQYGCYIKCLKCDDIQNDSAECIRLGHYHYQYTCASCGNVAIAIYGAYPFPIWEDTLKRLQNVS